MVDSRVESRGEHRAKMGWVQAGITLAVILSSGALYAALRSHKVEPGATEKAFRRLEGDVEDLFTRVESHLGRISRLKRGPGTPATPSAPNPAPPAETKPLTRAALYASARREHADKNRHGVGEQRGG